jgi:2',3'-cyclic-nucleotide 2'-phosphodiesterase (5'-nucleotidase family)
MTRRTRARRLSALLVAASLWSCRKADLPTQVPAQPSLRLYLMSTLAGAMEPCGCRKDMLGGIDHAAALLEAQDRDAPRRLVLAAGPLFFQEPELDPERRAQDLWKADAIAASLADLGLSAWAPGVNDFAAGAPDLARLTEVSRARLLGANLEGAGLTGSGVAAAATAIFDVGPYKVGVAGIGAAPGGGTPADAVHALEQAAAALASAGAQIRVALIAAQRGDGLRLAEKVPGFDVVALGKPTESGDANDAPFPPTLVGETLVVQAPNHLQALAYVDLFVLSDDFSFQDGVGIADRERRASLQGRIKDIEARIRSGAASSGQASSATPALQKELERTRSDLADIERRSASPPKTEGSVFRYGEVPVRESAGTEAKVAARMTQYYRKVNDYNRVALADRKPQPAPEGSSHYVGEVMCRTCHEQADQFWRSTQHAGAYATLSRQFKEFNLDCVSCHVTGYERPGGSTVTHVENLQNVQCESCHGPGSRHAESVGNTRLITLKPAESVCRGCHHTPHVADDWDAALAWTKITGPGHGGGVAPGQ